MSTESTMSIAQVAKNIADAHRPRPFADLRVAELTDDTARAWLTDEDVCAELDLNEMPAVDGDYLAFLTSAFDLVEAANDASLFGPDVDVLVALSCGEDEDVDGAWVFVTPAGAYAGLRLRSTFCTPRDLTNAPGSVAGLDNAVGVLVAVAQAAAETLTAAQTALAPTS